jgi:hypothetical protein
MPRKPLVAGQGTLALSTKCLFLSREKRGGLKNRKPVACFARPLLWENRNRMQLNTTTNPDGHLFVCKLCGNEHVVPEEKAPYWNGRMYRFLVGDIELGCAEKPGTALYTSGDFRPYRVEVTGANAR